MRQEVRFYRAPAGLAEGGLFAEAALAISPAEVLRGRRFGGPLISIKGKAAEGPENLGVER